MRKRGIIFLFISILIIPLLSGYQNQSSYVIYRVYVNDQMIGVLSDISIYEEYWEDKLETYKLHYSEDELIIPDVVRIEKEVTYIPYEAQNEKVLKIIDEQVKFKTKGYRVIIGDVSMYVKNIEDVVKEVELLMLLFINQEDLNRIRDLDNEIEPLTVEGEQVIGAKFSPDIEYVPVTCNIDDLASNQEIGNLLLTGNKEATVIGIMGKNQSMDELLKTYDLNSFELKLLNYRMFGSQSLPYNGQIYNVTPLVQTIEIEVEKEKVQQEVIEYETITIEDPTILVGEVHTEQEGENGVKLTSYYQKYINGKLAEEEIVKEEVLSEAKNRIIVKGTKEIPSRGTQDWQWPTTRTTITCDYLCYSGHYALDIAAYVGQPVFAADNGVVMEAEWRNGYGNNIFINHNNGYYTRYAHLSEINVSVGDIVAGGQVIGLAGNTGNSTGPHLHFEIRTDTGYQPTYAPNPMSFY